VLRVPSSFVDESHDSPRRRPRLALKNKMQCVKKFALRFWPNLPDHLKTLLANQAILLSLQVKQRHSRSCECRSPVARERGFRPPRENVG
jgi:hypothetical protein